MSFRSACYQPLSLHAHVRRQPLSLMLTFHVLCPLQSRVWTSHGTASEPAGTAATHLSSPRNLKWKSTNLASSICSRSHKTDDHAIWRWGSSSKGTLLAPEVQKETLTFSIQLLTQRHVIESLGCEAALQHPLWFLNVSFWQEVVCADFIMKDSIIASSKKP